MIIVKGVLKYNMSKKYDIVVFGGSGFTGRLVCDYLYNHKESKKIKWAVAGRDKDKLSVIADKYSVDCIVADSFNISSLKEMCESTKLVLSTVGPYMLYGENLVYSCIEAGTHYLDLTGEPGFVVNIFKKYRAKAISNESIVMHCCGFESIPADVAVHESLKHFDEENIDISFYLKTKGTISGGTWASFLNSVSSPNALIKSKGTKSNKSKKFFYSDLFNRWVLLFPVVDKYIVNKSIRSLNKFSRVSFNQYIIQKSLFSMISLVTGVLLISLVSRFSLFRKKLLNLIPSGHGPTADMRSKNWFKVIVIAESKSKKVTTTVSGGDPGYGETSKFISETALSIILNKDNLICDKGILTPMECTGDILTNRLKDAGISIQTETN